MTDVHTIGFFPHNYCVTAISMPFPFGIATMIVYLVSILYGSLHSNYIKYPVHVQCHVFTMSCVHVCSTSGQPIMVYCNDS